MKSITFTKKQKVAYDYMVQGKNVFVTGSGGVGKSSIIRTFANMYKNTKTISMTSTTGVSALLVGGKTLYSYLGIGLGKGSVDSLYRKINKSPYYKKVWNDLDVLIIDEISMLSPKLFDKLETLARKIRSKSLMRPNEESFGGIQLILSGDYLQLPCVESNDFCFMAKSWDKCVDHTIYLTEIIRQKDAKFQNCLNNVRMANITDETAQILQSRVGIDLINNKGIKPTKLFPLNRDVDYINEKELKKLDTIDFYEYNIEFEFKKACKNKTQFMERIAKYTPAAQVLTLAVGAQVMLITNLDLECKLANGSRGVIVGFVEDLPKVRFINGVERVIDHHVWEIEEREEKVLNIIQIPLKLAWGVSIHKCQGSTLDYVEIDLENIFEYGQSYVALSRVKNLNGLKILSLDLDKIRANPEAVEYYKNLLKD